MGLSCNFHSVFQNNSKQVRVTRANEFGLHPCSIQFANACQFVETDDLELKYFPLYHFSDMDFNCLEGIIFGIEQWKLSRISMDLNIFHIIFNDL